MTALGSAHPVGDGSVRGEAAGWLIGSFSARTQVARAVAFGLCIALALAISPAAARAQDDDAPQRRPVIGLVMKTLTNPFFSTMERGARRAAAEAGAEVIVRTPSRETAIEQQIGMVDAMTKVPVDALVIAPGDSARLVPVLVSAARQGIVVVNVDNQLDFDYWQRFGLPQPPLVTVDNRKAADRVTERMLRGDDPGTPARAVIVGGIPDADNSRQRVEGAANAFRRHPNIEVVATLTGNWRLEEAHDAALAFLSNNPDIRYIFCANDMMAVGVLQAVREKGLKNTLIAGFDNLAEIQPSIADGSIIATVDQNAEEQGYLAVRIALDLLAGRQVSQRQLVDTKVIDKQALVKSRR